MERYLDAARKISRLAVGDPAMPVMVNIHQLDPEHPQDERVDELPFGTRGGIAVRSEFPVDGTYIVKVDVGAAQGHELEITVDGERVALRSLGGGGRGAPAVDAPPGQPDPADPDPTPPSVARPAVPGRGAGPAGAAGAAGAGGGRAGGRGRGAAPGPLEFPLTLKAGPKLIGVAFVQRTEARDEATLRPRMRSRGTQPAINSVTISGPYNATGRGDSPSRRRIFVCRPVGRGRRSFRARARILSTLARRAYRRPVDRRGPAGPAAVLRARPQRGQLRSRHPEGARAAARQLAVPVPHRARAGERRRRHGVSRQRPRARLAAVVLPLEQHPGRRAARRGGGGRLKDPKVLEQQVRRMLADPRSRIAGHQLRGAVAVPARHRGQAARRDPVPDFDETLRAAMQRETELFVDSVFRENRSVLDLLTRQLHVPQRAAGAALRRAEHQGQLLPPRRLPGRAASRGGLLGQGSVLTITSYSTRTSPVLRGKWVLENLLSAAPPPPPADVPSLKTETAPGKPLTLREAMIQHRASPGVRRLPRADGPDRLRDGELRRRRALARARRRAADRRHRRRSRRGRNSRAFPG